MSTKYQILDDRPIDKWKVTELREELKKRKLTTRGLKKDLVKRLDDALRIERAKNTANEADDDDDINPDSQPIVEEEEEAEKTTPTTTTTTTTTIVEKVKDVVLPGDCGTAKISVTQTVVMEVPSIEQHVQSSKQEENVNSNEQIENEGPKIEVNCDSIVGKSEVKGNTMEENVDISLDVVKPETVEPYSSSNVPLVSGESHPTDDERDVNSNTQIENEGPKIEVSCDSIDEKIEVKGNTMDDNVERCLDVVKPEMVEPYSSSNIVLVSAESHPTGDEHDVDSNVKIENEGPKIEVKCDSVAEKSEVKGNATDENVDIRLDVVKPETAEPFSSSNVVLASAESHSTDHEHDVNSNIQIENEGPKTEVKCDSIDKKIEVKDNTMEDNVETNVDAIKPETVEPYSSSNVVQASGESHPTDDEHVQPVKNEASVDGTYDHNNESGEMGYSEKLNLDRSSGDESMEEDLVETKQVDSKCSADEILGENSVKNEALVIKEESPVGVGGVIVGESSSTGKKEESPLVVEKRKMHDMEAIGNNEPTKRHKLDPDNLQLPEEQDSNLSLINTSRVAASKSTSDSTDSENTPKERVVPPSQKPPTTSLRVEQFLRPFTLKAVQELLGKTGIITSFWMDHIKTHCYVTYSSVEEAIETRNAIYNLQWPPNGGRQLVAEFVDPHQVEIHLQTPPATTTNNTDACGFTAPQQVSERKPSPSQRSSNSLSVRSRQPIPPPPPEEPDSPMATIDDIFWKTKATPKIYYLPLSQEQVAAKQARRATKTSW